MVEPKAKHREAMVRINITTVVLYGNTTLMKIDEEHGCIAAIFTSASPAPVDEPCAVIGVPGDIALPGIVGPGSVGTYR